MLKTIYVMTRDWWRQSFVRAFAQEFSLRANRNDNMKGLLWLVGFAFVIATVTGDYLINPTFRLEEMTKQEGLVVDARYRGGDRVVETKWF